MPLDTCRQPKAPWGAIIDTLKGNFFVFWAILKILKPTTMSDECITFFSKVTLNGPFGYL